MTQIAWPAARDIGRPVYGAFQRPEPGGCNLEAGIEQVYTAFAACTNLGHLALYDLGGEARWLELARANADALAAVLGGPDGGYAYRHHRCVDRAAPGRAGGEGAWIVDRTRDTAAQALIRTSGRPSAGALRIGAYGAGTDGSG